MKTLTEVIQDPERVEAVVADAARLLDEEVAGKSGLSGMAIRAGYATVKRIRPGMIQQAIRHLLPEFSRAVDPHYARAREAGDVRAHFTAHAGEIADALLAITDGKAARAKNRVVKRAYDSLRPQARRHTSEAMPRLAELIERHVS